MVCVLLTAVVVAQAGCGGTPAANVPTATSHIIPPTPPSGPRHIRQALPQWRAHVPDALGDRAAGLVGTAWVTHREDGDQLWLAVAHHARQLLTAGDGVMEGSDDLHSPLWIGRRLIWAVSHAWDGCDYDSWIVSYNPRSGARRWLKLHDAYVRALSRDHGNLAVRYVPSDDTGRSIGPDPRRQRIGRLRLSQTRWLKQR